MRNALKKQHWSIGYLVWRVPLLAQAEEHRFTVSVNVRWRQCMLSALLLHRLPGSIKPTA